MSPAAQTTEPSPSTQSPKVGFAGSLLLSRSRRLVWIQLLTALAAGLVGNALAAPAPYAVDAATLHLWHLDETSTPCVDAVACGTNLTSLNSGATLGVANVSFPGFGNCLNTVDGGQSSTTQLDASLSALPLVSGTGDDVALTLADPVTGAFTFEALVRVDFDPSISLAARGSAMQIISGDGDGTLDRVFQWRLMPVGITSGSSDTNVTRMEFANIRQGAAIQTITFPVPTNGMHAIASNQWYHVAVTYNGNENTVNNLLFYWTRADAAVTAANLISAATMSNDLSVAACDFVLGNEGRATGGSTGNFIGLIDEVRISRVARADDQMLFATNASPVVVQNMVTNGGFEYGINTGWSHNASGGAAASFSTEANQPYAGAKALKVVITAVVADVWRVQTLGPTFSLPSGTPATITFRGRAASPNTQVRFVMQADGGSYLYQDFTLSTNWTFYLWSVNTWNTAPRLRIQYPDVGTVWLDEISVVTHSTSGIGIGPNPSVRNQIMDGIGGSIAFNLPDYEALSATKKDEIENLLYVDCGIDIVRLRTGNSDALNANLAMRAQRNGAKSLLTSWSPPASLKSNNSIVSGTLRIVSGNYDYAGFADWWYARLQASGWIHDFISIQNEPSFDPGDKETCRFFATETVPATTNGSASYKLALETVYNKIKNEPKIPQFIAGDSESHGAFKTLAPTVSGLSYVNHLGFHNYGANDFAGVKSKYNGNRGWMTEWGADPDIKDNWMVLASNIHQTLTESDASAYLCWRMVHGNNTGQVWAMIGVESLQYKVQNAFYAVKHYAKEISPGDQRFQVTETGSNADVGVSGYIDPTGKKLTLIALNTGSAAANVSLRLSALPVISTATFQTKRADTNATGFLTNPYQALGSVNHLQGQTLPAQSITTYVVNLSETLNSYNPALLRINSVNHLGNQLSLAMPAQPGHDFILWRSTTLAAGSWQAVTNAVRTEQDGQLILTDPNPDPIRAFYRIQRDTGL